MHARLNDTKTGEPVEENGDAAEVGVLAYSCLAILGGLRGAFEEANVIARFGS